MSEEFWKDPIRKKAFQLYIKEGCEYLLQTRNDDIAMTTFYCKLLKCKVPGNFCIACITNRLREQNG